MTELIWFLIGAVTCYLALTVIGTVIRIRRAKRVMRDIRQVLEDNGIDFDDFDKVFVADAH